MEKGYKRKGLSKREREKLQSGVFLDILVATSLIQSVELIRVLIFSVSHVTLYCFIFNALSSLEVWAG